ncbi:MAG: hypothetical protein ACPGJS_02400 [Flammeovirgaceae bacterium]
MKNPKQFFHLLSYLQYPILLVSLYYYAFFIISLVQANIQWAELNNVLVFYGISVSFSTLQDTTKTQNKFSRKIWEHPTKGKIALVMIALLAFGFIIIGLIGTFINTESVFKELSFGLTVLGIGVIGMLKAAMEMFENHRKDKNGESS